MSVALFNYVKLRVLVRKKNCFIIYVWLVQALNWCVKSPNPTKVFGQVNFAKERKKNEVIFFDKEMIKKKLKIAAFILDPLVGIKSGQESNAFKVAKGKLQC